MFVGHGLIAFAGAAGVASLYGYRRERALALGVCAGAFALAPDVDIVYAPVGLADAALTGSNLVEGFWEHGNLVHRAVTHSLVVGAIASVAAGCWAAVERRRVELRGEDGSDSRGASATVSGVTAVFAASVAFLLLGGLTVVVGSESGPLGAVVLSLFAATSLALATVGVRWGLSAREISAVALVGFLSHPFGDLFTGEPPAFFYPFDATLVTARISLHPDPTLHLLGAFAIELATVWLAALTYASLSDRSLKRCIDWRAALGVGYAGAALALPAPTLDSSYRFVLSVLALGVAAGVAPVPKSESDGSAHPGQRSDRWIGRSLRRVRGRWRARDRSATGGLVRGVSARAVEACRRTVLADPFGAALTGLTAVTLALVAYAMTYVYAV